MGFEPMIFLKNILVFKTNTLNHSVIYPNIFLKFYKKPNENDILKVANKFYKNINFQIPRNHDYSNFKKEIKKTYNMPFSGDFQDLNKFLNEIFIRQKHTFKINVSL